MTMLKNLSIGDDECDDCAGKDLDYCATFLIDDAIEFSWSSSLNNGVKMEPSPSTMAWP